MNPGDPNDWFLFHYHIHPTALQSSPQQSWCSENSLDFSSLHQQENQSTPGAAEESPRCCSQGAPALSTGIHQELWSRAAIAPWVHLWAQGPSVTHLSWKIVVSYANMWITLELAYIATAQPSVVIDDYPTIEIPSQNPADFLPADPPPAKVGQSLRCSFHPHKSPDSYGLTVRHWDVGDVVTK